MSKCLEGTGPSTPLQPGFLHTATAPTPCPVSQLPGPGAHQCSCVWGQQWPALEDAAAFPMLSAHRNPQPPLAAKGTEPVAPGQQALRCPPRRTLSTAAGPLLHLPPLCWTCGLGLPGLALSHVAFPGAWLPRQGPTKPTWTRAVGAVRSVSVCGALTPWPWWHSGLGEALLALLALQLAPASACCNRGGSEGSSPVGNSSLAPQELCQSVNEGVGGQGPSPQQSAAVGIGPPGEARRDRVTVFPDTAGMWPRGACWVQYQERLGERDQAGCVVSRVEARTLGSTKS